MQPVYLLGLGLPHSAECAGYSPSSNPILQKADVLVGGRAQLAPFADHRAEKLIVTSEVETLYRRMESLRSEGKLLVALCSGDPMFFGLGARLAERFGPENLRLLPALSSMQAAASYLCLPWENMRPVSLHGRKSMLPLAHALMEHSHVFLLCDGETSPPGIAAWMLERGCSSHIMHLLDDLCLGPDGSVAPAAHTKLRLEEAAALVHTPHKGQRVIVLQAPDTQPGRKNKRPPSPAKPFGIPDACLEKDKGVFTKLPVRGAGLAALGIEPCDIVWDIGAGSGAVSIEAARLACRGQVIAIEARETRIARILANRRKFSALNLNVIRGLFPDCLDCLPHEEALPRPGKIFIGGGLGSDREKAGRLLHRAWQELQSGGRLLVHCVLLSSLECARAQLSSLTGDIQIQSITVAQSANVGNDIQLKALNPVFLILAIKNE